MAVDPEGLSLTALIDEAGEEVVLLVESVFGTEFQTYQLASPNVVLTQDGNPVADALVITRGPIERQALAFDFADLAMAHGAAVEVVVAEQYDESQIAAAIGDPADAVVNAPIVAFLDRCFA